MTVPARANGQPVDLTQTARVKQPPTVGAHTTPPSGDPIRVTGRLSHVTDHQSREFLPLPLDGATAGAFAAVTDSSARTWRPVTVEDGQPGIRLEGGPPGYYMVHVRAPDGAVHTVGRLVLT